jgi:hypothetical protein
MFLPLAKVGMVMNSNAIEVNDIILLLANIICLFEITTLSCALNKKL